MDDRIKMLDALSDKTKKEIQLFVTNSFLSENEGLKKDFYQILEKVMVESLFATNRTLKK